MSTSLDSTLALIAEPRRQQIVQQLWHGSRTVGELHSALSDISLSAVSQHLAKLRDAGVVEVRTEGRHRHYSIDREGLGPLADALDAMWASKLDALAHLAEAREREEAP